MRVLALALLGLGFPGGLEAQVRLGGQVRPRHEYRNSGAAPGDRFTTMRLRADLTATLERGVSALVQLQDVRTWGEELSTVTDARAADLGVSQGYAQVTDGGATGLVLRAGRQPLSLGEERLVGALDWVQRGRSFDGLRLTATRGAAALDGFAFVLSDRTAAGITADAAFAGVNGKLAPGGSELEGYWLFHQADSPETRLSTGGGRWSVRRGRLESRVEAAYQFGRRAGAPVTAYLVAARVTASLVPGRAAVTLWYDRLSGDDAPGTGDDHAFSTLFATNHKFYGIADLFTDFPAHTGGRGLQDAAVKMAFTPAALLQLALDAHAFSLTDATGAAGSRLGEELDLVATWRHSANLVVSGGAAWLRDGPAVRALGRLSGDLAFAYVMMDVKF